MPGRTLFFGLLRRREMTVPSLRGLAVLFLAGLGTLGFLARTVHPFLAVNRPLGGEVLVVEGWIPDYALQEALRTFRSRPYKLLLTTGGPLPQGMAYSSYGTHAHLAAESLRSMGLGADSLAEVPSPEVNRDRTYQEGLSLRAWMQDRGRPFSSLDLVSFSAHARRSRLLYGMALGKGIRVGVYAPRDRDYDPGTWWKTSNGVRRVGDEIIAYLYARLWFRG